MKEQESQIEMALHQPYYKLAESDTTESIED